MLRHLSPERINPSRVVIIGAGGFVGGAIRERLDLAKIGVLPLTRSDIDLQAPDAAKRLRAYLLPGDAIVAVAARAPCRNLDMLIENIRITKTIVDAIKDAPISHVINISSDAVYGDEPVPIFEGTPMSPSTLHGVMHRAREIAFQNEVGAPLAILRPTLLYGLADPHNGYGPNRFRRLAEAGKDIVLFGAGEERRDHVWIEDLAEIVVRTLMRRSVGGLNVASGEVYSFRAIAELVVEASARQVAIVETPRNGPMPHNGYRPFEISAVKAAFPDFDYVKLPAGIRGLAGADGTMTHG
jgi:nucleoside-diphosphate-sugar epimerase